ncbi:hypothetical protein CLIB1444_12S00254 [[Candida] jaroonii]|uniref:Uncharacterized protein n=1 Tax=[Candida] jaroonii TaxID=467808 RepID=A0ACA9YEC7_9ASCO|nr:hypothetical protein CLIB1444_12S00254 [[Candida] jaroonii]
MATVEKFPSSSDMVLLISLDLPICSHRENYKNGRFYTKINFFFTMVAVNFLDVIDLSLDTKLFGDGELELLEHKIFSNISLMERGEPISVPMVENMFAVSRDNVKHKPEAPISTQRQPFKRNYPKSPAPGPTGSGFSMVALIDAIKRSPSLNKRIITDESTVSRNSSFTSFIQLPEYHPPEESDLIMYQKYITCLSMGSEESEIVKPEFPKCPTSTHLANYVHKKYIYNQFLNFQLKRQRSYHNKYANIKLKHHFDMKLSRTVSRRFSKNHRSSSIRCGDL